MDRQTELCNFETPHPAVLKEYVGTQPTEHLSFAAGCSKWLNLRQRTGLVLCPIVVLIFLCTEHKTSITPLQHRMIGVVCLVGILFMSELVPIPVTGMCVGPLLVLFRVCKIDAALSPYATNISFLLWGSFFLTTAMTRHELDKRFAAWITGLSFVRGVPCRMRAAIMCAAALMSLVLNGPAVLGIVLPMLMALSGARPAEQLSDPVAQRGLSGDILVVLYASLSGGMGTLISPPCMICVATLATAGVDVGFIEWMCLGLPTAFIVNLVGFSVMHWAMAPSATQETQASTLIASARLRWGEKVTLGCFIVTTTLWVFPGAYKSAGGPFALEIADTLPIGIVAILGSLPLFLIPDVSWQQAVLPWREAVRNADWAIVMIVGGGMSMGKQIFSTGLARLMAESFLSWSGVDNIISMTYITIVLTTLLTEMLSNLATIAMLCPIVFAIAQQIDSDPLVAMTPVVAVPFAACCSFMTPWASALNAMAYGTGHVALRQMLIFGCIMNVLCSLVIFATVTRLVPIIWPPGSQ